ncbi:hypothetical protein BFG05_06360 [Campylobacter pinnipediorum subsp. pinnipediorum]|uniref:TonB-dependent receptor domain-containing protein n=1 Tax=Campylobacter pinnipediorum TaxID=1965231 RepID=UPI0009C87AE5|nr:TonB-dependent receptor [Campylobacter pinnipediorum]OPA75492.1 hypothetical protein BFG05_06360 [Campylobacter pinnipediorum subsp. pinnipediorum]
MNNLFKTGLSIVLIANILSVAHAANEVELDSVEIVDQYYKERIEAYKKSGAVSIRDEINKSDKTLDTIIRSIPGTFTQMNKGAGAVTVNIRGGTGFGRVNTMVDGVSQTFYSSGGDTGGKGGAGSQFGASIDPSFITSVELNRGSFKGSGGANSLMGSSNFKTIGVDDILRFDRDIGGMVKSQVGSNDMRPEHMFAVAGKRFFNYGGALGFLYGHSEKTISQNYEVGGGETHEQKSLRDTKRISDDYEREYYPEKSPYDSTPYDPEKVRQKPKSDIFKIEYTDDYNSLELQYRTLNNHLAGRSIKNKTKQINYNLNIPDNNLINFNFLYSNNFNQQNYDIGAEIINRRINKPLTGENKAEIFDISNTFEFELPKDSTLSTTFGLNILENKYSRNRYPDELKIYKICEEGEDNDDCLVSTSEFLGGTFSEAEKINAALPTNSFFPQGEQKFKAFYLDNSINWDKLTFDYNINFVKYKNKGESLLTVSQFVDELNDQWNKLDKIWKKLPKNSKEREALEPEFNRLKELYKPYYDWSKVDQKNMNDQDEVKKGFTQNPNNIITKQDKVKDHFLNYSFMVTANLNEYFTPFIGLSRTHRAPTIQEMFFSNLSNAGKNLSLKPETAKTKQIGFNGFTQGVMTKNDTIGYKFTRYQTRIENFIHNILSYRVVPGKYLDGTPVTVGTIYHRNHNEEVSINGFEAEISYDMGTFFANASFAKQRTNQPASYSDISRTADNITVDQADAQSFGLTKVTILPNQYGSLELGVRLFDQKLTLGGIAKYYGKSKRSKYDTTLMCEGGAKPIHPLDNHGNFNFERALQCPKDSKGNQYKSIGQIAEYEEFESQPIIYDIYATYEPSKNFMIKFAIDNLTDKLYVNPLDANNDSASQYAKVIHTKQKNGKYFYTEYFQNNFARGRTAKLMFSYKF